MELIGFQQISLWSNEVYRGFEEKEKESTSGTNSCLLLVLLPGKCPFKCLPPREKTKTTSPWEHTLAGGICLPALSSKMRRGEGFTVQAVFLKKLSKSPELSLRPYLKPVFADGLRMESLGVTFNQYHRVLIKGRSLDTERDVPWEKLSKSGAKESQRLPASHRRLTCDVPPTINTFFVRGPTVMVREMCKRFSVTILRGNCPRDTLSSDVYLSEWRTINVHCLSHLVCSALLQNLSKWQRAWMGHLHPLSRSNTILFLWWDPISTCISLPISVSSSRYFLDYIIFGHHHLYA